MYVGKKINDRYKVIDTIGGGGMANVFLAHDLILDRDVAVKILRYDFRDDSDVIRRFQREAQAATTLVHPNIVAVYDVGEEQNIHYIVMEYVKGTDLKKYIQRSFPIPYQKVIDIMGQILSAVEHAHRNKIIHRDLKPQNILIDEDGNVKITDFGIAVALSETSITQTNSLLGSVHYMSPEQAKGGLATNQSDIYALGIILYELLTGHVPFEGESAVSIALKHFQEALPSVREFDPRIPQPLENVVLKATTKDPIDRYSSVDQMWADLSTSLSTSRIDEPKFIPTTSLDETKIMKPILPPETTSVEAVEKENEEAAEFDVVDKDDKKKNKNANKKKRKKWPYITAGLVVLAILGIVLALALSAPKDVSVPDVTGMTEVEARDAIEKAKLKLGSVTQQPSDAVEKGKVIKTDPKSGRSVKEKTTVNLYISTGKDKVKIEDYVGEDYEEVKAKLTKAGYTVTKEEVENDSVEAGKIISQDPEAGTAVVPKDTTITFTVSAGPASFTLRDLTQYTRKSVEDYANENGLILTIQEEYSSTVEAGLVISQSPAANKAVYPGSALTVTISKGPKEEPTKEITRTITIPYVADLGGSTDSSATDANKKANKITIYIEDETHDIAAIADSFEITEDKPYTFTFKIKVGSSAKYKVYRDGNLILSDDNVQ